MGLFVKVVAAYPRKVSRHQYRFMVAIPLLAKTDVCIEFQADIQGSVLFGLPRIISWWRPPLLNSASSSN